MAIRKDTVQIDIIVNGEKGSKTYRDLIKQSRQLKREILDLTPGTDEFVRKSQELQKVNQQLFEIRKGTTGVKRGLDDIRIAGLKIPGVFKSIAGGIAAGLATTSISAIIGKLTSLGVSLDATDRKAKTVFGSYVSIVEDFARRHATAMGLTESEYKKVATAAGDLLIPMGFQREEAAQLSGQLINLSGATAEWSGGQYTATETSEILTKALLGEREQLKSLGISIQEADVKQRLAEKGMKDLTGQALQQAKALATLELITERSADAQAQYAENSESVERPISRLRSGLNQIGEVLARTILPTFSRFVGAVANFIAPAKSSSEITREMNAEFNILIETLKRGNLSQENRSKLIQTINEQYEDYLPNLIKETDQNRELNEIQIAVNDAFREKIKLLAAEEAFKAVRERIVAAGAEEIRLAKELTKAQEKLNELNNEPQRGPINAGVNTAGTNLGVETAEKKIRELNRAIEDNKDLQDELQQEYTETANAAIKLGIDLNKLTKSTKNNKGGRGGGGGDNNDDPEDQLAARLKAEELAAERLEITRTIQFNEGEINEKAFQESIKNIRLESYEEQLNIYSEFGKSQAIEAERIRLKISELQKTPPAEIDPYLSVFGFTKQQMQDAIAFRADQIEKGLLDEEILLNTKLNNGIIAEQEYQQELLRIKIDSITKQLEFLESTNQTDTLQYRDYLNQKLQLQRQYNEQSQQIAEDSAQRQAQLFQQGFDQAEDVFSQTSRLIRDDLESYKQSLNQKYDQLVESGRLTRKEAEKQQAAEEDKRKRALKLYKAFEVARINVALAAEIQGIWKNANSNPLNALIPGWGKIYAAIETALAIGRATTQVAKVQKAKFEGGGKIPRFPARTGGMIEGPSHDDGGVSFKTRSGFVGEAEGGELILNRQQQLSLRSRHGSGVFSGIGLPEFREGGQVPKFINGGQISDANTTPSASVVDPALANQTSDTAINLEGIERRLDRLIGVVERWPTHLRASVPLSAIQEAEDDQAFIESVANG